MFWDGKRFQENTGSSGSRADPEVKGATTKSDVLNQLQSELASLLKTVNNDEEEEVKEELEEFAQIFKRALEETGHAIDWDKIEKLPDDAVKDYNTLKAPTSPNTIHSLLSKVIVIKFNGSRAIRMGCKGPKSAMVVKNKFTFLDLTVQQIQHLNKTYSVNVPLILMNSHYTDESTKKIITKYKNFQVEIHTVHQSCYPKLNKDTLLPFAKKVDVLNDLEAWGNSGHGDIYKSLKKSGLLRKFIQEGREYCFVSKIDNLGATVDLSILNLLLNPEDNIQHEFVMEVTDKTTTDVTGGTLIQYQNKLRLLEIAQVPKEHIDDFRSVKHFQFFNTNNLWVKLEAIERLLAEDLLDLDIVIINRVLSGGMNVIKLQTTAGSAIKLFKNVIGINVPRSRYIPVKHISDFLLMMSNLYSVKHGSLVISPKRIFSTTPIVKLCDCHFSTVQELLERFDSPPDLIDLDHLTVSGDVIFGKNVSMKGTVIITGNHRDQIAIPSCSILENKIVSGNLSILDY